MLASPCPSWGTEELFQLGRILLIRGVCNQPFCQLRTIKKLSSVFVKCIVPPLVEVLVGDTEHQLPDNVTWRELRMDLFDGGPALDYTLS